jgi:hypothetical protein
MDDPIADFFSDVDSLARAGCYQLSYIEILSGKNTIELRVSIFKVYVHLKKICGPYKNKPNEALRIE